MPLEQIALKVIQTIVAIVLATSGLVLFYSVIRMMFCIKEGSSLWRDLYGSSLNAIFLPHVLNAQGMLYRRTAIRTFPIALGAGLGFGITEWALHALSV